MSQRQVNRGVELLDRKLGRDVWLDRVDLDALKLWDGSGSCVASQACGGVRYRHALARLGVDWFDQARYGFNSYGLIFVDGAIKVLILQWRWKRTIERLRAGRDAAKRVQPSPLQLDARGRVELNGVVTPELLRELERTLEATQGARLNSRERDRVLTRR